MTDAIAIILHRRAMAMADRADAMRRKRVGRYLIASKLRAANG